MAFKITMQSTEQDFAVGFDPNDSEQEFPVGFESEDKSFGMEFDGAQIVETGNHAMLSNRDAPEQHPIKSIVNLEGELNVRSSQAMTNIDIESIINM